MTERAERCDKCKWWYQHPAKTKTKDKNEMGQCRRYPPTGMSEWLERGTYDINFCGEFTSVEEAVSLQAEVRRLRDDRAALLTHLERCVQAADSGDWFNDVEVWTPAEEAVKAAKVAGNEA
jgi:hypothetical protein